MESQNFELKKFEENKKKTLQIAKKQKFKTQGKFLRNILIFFFFNCGGVENKRTVPFRMSTRKKNERKKNQQSHGNEVHNG